MARQRVKMSRAESPQETPEVELSPDRAPAVVEALPLDEHAVATETAVNEETALEPSANSSQALVEAHSEPDPAVDEETLLFSGLCPLCWTSDIVNPVLLHGSAVKRASSREAVLVACRECAVRWAPALHARDGGESALSCPFCAHAVDVAEPQQLEALTSGERLKSMRFCNPITSLDGKPTLFSLAAAKERNSAACGICEEPGATTVCVQCDFALCRGCEKATHSKGKFKEHERISFDSAQKRQQLKCPVHPSHSLDLYCQTCAECVCISCCFGGDAHKGHDVAQLPEVAATATDELRRVLQTLEDTAKAADKVQSKVAALRPFFEQCVDGVERDIQGSFAALREALTTREEQLLAKLRDARRERGADIDTCIAVGSCLSTELGASARSMEKALAEADAVTVLRLREQLSHAAAAMDGSTTHLVRHLQSAESGLRARLDPSSAASARVASFHLLSPQESSEVAVKKYREVLQTLGQLTTASHLAKAQSHGPAPAAAAVPAVRERVPGHKSRSHSQSHSHPHDETEASDSEGPVPTMERGRPVPPPAPTLPRLVATVEEPPRPVVVVAAPPALVAAPEPETFRFPPLSTVSRAAGPVMAPLWNTSVPVSESLPPLSLDLAFGVASTTAATRRTEAHTLSVQPSSQRQAPFALHADSSSSFSFTKPRAASDLSASIATGWDAGLKLGSKRFAPLDVNIGTEFPAKRARQSPSREETNTTQPTSSGSTGNLQLRL